MQLEQQQVSYCCCSLETALALNSASKLLFLFLQNAKQTLMYTRATTAEIVS